VGGPLGAFLGGCIVLRSVAKRLMASYAEEGGIFKESYDKALKSGKLEVKSDVWIKRTQSLTY
jgi:hypothetical protein